MTQQQQQFFLRWDNYSSYISYAFGTLRNQEDLVDVTLSCEGKKIRAHKVLLSACSTYFRDVFKDNPCQHPVIIFKNVKFDDLLAIIEFMYQGEVSVVQDALSSFLNTAELLSVQGLTEGNGNAQATSTGTLIDTSTPQLIATTTTTVPKAVALKPVTFNPQPERRFAKKVYPGQTTATTIKTVTHPITVYSSKPANNVQGATKRLVTPVKLTTTSGGVMMSGGAPTLVTTTTTLNDAVDGAGGTIQLQATQPQILNPGAQTTDGSQQPQVKRKRILFDTDENISIEDVNYVKQQMDMDMPDYIEIQTSSVGGAGSGDDEKNMVDLMSGADSDSQAQEHVIIEEGFDGGHGDDDDEDKDKEMEITYTKDDQGNGTVVLTPVRDSSKDGDKQQVNFVQAASDGSSTKWAQCSYCKLVITSVNLWRHVRTQHTAQQPQECTYCQKNFKNKYSLREHIRIAHEKQTTGSATGGAGGGGKTGDGNEDGTETTTDAEIVLVKAEK